MRVAQSLEEINKKIAIACNKVNRSTEEITIVAVTKYVTIERAQEAIEAGITNLGENRDETILPKYEVIQNKVKWHFIGSLQTRKVKNIIHMADYIHSLDRLSLAEEINKRASHPIKCLVQVNVSEEESKHGLQVTEVIPYIYELKQFPNVEVVGLMTMAPNTEDEQIIRSTFRGLKQLQVEIKQLNIPYAPCQHLSMGMSNDYEIAIEEGATMIRIGSALVGE